MHKVQGSDAASSVDRMDAVLEPPHQRYRRDVHTQAPAPVVRLLDALEVALAAAFLFVMFAARFHYNRWPLFVLVLPALRALFSSHYRGRLRNALRSNVSDVRAFAAGAGPIPWKAAVWLVVVPFFLFDISNGAIVGSIDTRPVIPTAISLVREGNWDVSEFDSAGGRSALRDREGNIPLSFQIRGDRIYSVFPSGMVFFAAPVVELARICGADLDDRSVHLRLEKITAATAAALCLGLYFLTASCLGSAPAAAISTCLLAVSSSLYTTVGLGLWQHGGVVFWGLLALLVEFSSGGMPSRRGSILQGMACAAMLTCRPTAALGVVGLGGWIFFRSPKRAVFTLTVAAISYLPCIALYESLYGNMLGPHTIPLAMTEGRWHIGRLDRLAGVFVCPGRGLFVYQPWALLAPLAFLPAVRRMVKDRDRRARPSGWMAYCLVIPLIHCAVVSAWHDWSGGYCWGSRLLTDVIPPLGLLSVPAIEWLWRAPRTRPLILALAVAGMLTHIPCVYGGAAAWNYVTDHDRDLWSWSNAPFLYRPAR